jgi:hypothetical protein
VIDMSALQIWLAVLIGRLDRQEPAAAGGADVSVGAAERQIPTIVTHDTLLR